MNTERDSMIYQRNSLSRLCITRNAFEALLFRLRVFLPVLDLIQAFGFKKNATEHSWAGYRTYVSTQYTRISDQRRKEICYNFYYMERTNRTKGDPWSFRQSGIYQQMYPDGETTSWIILQPPNGMIANIKEAFDVPIEETNNVAKRTVIGLRLHVTFITFMATNWAEYVEHLQCQLSDLVSLSSPLSSSCAVSQSIFLTYVLQNDKACFAKTNPRTNYGYNVDISDCQTLQMLRRDLLRTSTALGTCLTVARGSLDHCQDTQLPEPNASKTACMSELKYHIQQIQHQCSRVDATVVEAEATVNLVSSVTDSEMDFQLTYASFQNYLNVKASSDWTRATNS